MADNSNKQLLVVLDKYVDRASELVVVTTKTKNRNSVEATSAETMDMKTFISRSFSTKMYVNIFDAATEEWLWKTNPKVTHIHERCVELWGPKDEVEKEEELEEDELETEESVEEEEPESEEPAEEADSDESEPTEESKQDLFAAARAAVANRKAKDSSTTSKPSTKKANKPSSKKVDKSSNKAESEPEEVDEDDETEKKSGGLIWVLAIVVLAIMSVSIWLTLKPGRELETLGLTAQYTEATNRLNEAVEPAWYRWESWDREVAAEATLAWGPYFRALYVTGEGANPTPNSIQLYAVYLTLKVLTQQGWEPGEALRIIREDSSKVVIDALNKGNISSEDIAFIKEYMMK
jgi:DNA polymerase III gamma/tau subunit